MPPKIVITEADLLKRLKAKYPLPEWVFLEQVRSGTGGNYKRTADALAINCWPSRGFEIQGFEIKSYRADWKKELRDLEKADEIMKYCHRWWIIADKAIVGESEIPITWGWMVPHGDGLMIKTQAPLLKPAKPGPAFMLSVIRNLSDENAALIKKEDLEVAIEAGVKKRLNDHVGQYKYELSRLKEIENDVHTFERNSGIKIAHWDVSGDGKLAGIVVDALKYGGIASVHNLLGGYIKHMSDLVMYLENAKKRIDDLTNKPDSK